MIDRTAPAASGPADPLHLLTNLTIALTREAEFHTRQMTRFDDLLAARVQGIRAEFQSRTPDLHGDVMSALNAELARTRRAKWYVGVFALLVIILGAVLFYLAVNMTHEMNRMEDYMYNMGHSPNDDRPIAQDERKNPNSSYLLAMAEYMQAMRDDIGAMRLAITRMDGSIAGMSKDMQTMSGTMGQLRQDTAMMRSSVGGMANDTRSMGAPMGFMSRFFPW